MKGTSLDGGSVRRFFRSLPVVVPSSEEAPFEAWRIVIAAFPWLAVRPRLRNRLAPGGADASLSDQIRFTAWSASSRPQSLGSPNWRAAEFAPGAWARLIPQADPAKPIQPLAPKKRCRCLPPFADRVTVFEITAGRSRCLLSPPSAPGRAARERILSAGAVFVLGGLLQASS